MDLKSQGLENRMTFSEDRRKSLDENFALNKE